MSISKAILIGTAMVAAVSATAAAQQAAVPAVPANPTPGCTVPMAEREANQKVAMAFFTTVGDARVALADPTYIQHNPVFKQRALDAKLSDYEEFKASFGSGAPAGGPAGGGGGPGAAAGAQPPAGNPFEIVTTDCDITVIVHKQYRPDPAKPGQFYAAFTFDAFRVRNGKLVEHWDTAVINPAPAAAGAAAGAN